MDRHALGSWVTPRRLLWMTAALAALWSAGAFLIPMLESRGALSLAISDALRLPYRPVCHQIPARCLDVYGHEAAVCARCAGLYLGGTAGLILAAALHGRLRTPARMWLAIAVAPTVLDFVAGVIAGVGLPEMARLVVTLPAGFVLALFLGEGVADLPRAIRKAIDTHPSRTSSVPTST